jgi:serine/threonine-protein kinase HipA
MGALEYLPEHLFLSKNSDFDLDKISKECEQILSSNDSDDLDELFALGGSSGGARPKILTKINDEDWIIKFPSSTDAKNIGEIEYLYSLCARDCGIEIPETRLFESKECSGYFGVKRFDRAAGEKVHMISVSGLLETSHRIPNLDYNLLMKLTLELTKSYEEVEKMYRLMCFNVFAHNRDDHSKNFSFIYKDNLWQLSPAYDLTYSSSIHGEHATTVNGEGKNPSLGDVLAVANNIGLKLKMAKEIALEVEDKTKTLRKHLTSI